MTSRIRPRAENRSSPRSHGSPCLAGVLSSVDRALGLADRATAAAARPRRRRLGPPSRRDTRLWRRRRRPCGRDCRLVEGCARRGRECDRFSYRGDFAHRTEGSQPRRDSHHRRRDRARLAVVPRRRRGADTAVGKSLDRRCRRPQALSGSLADHDYRAAGFCAVAAGRPRQRHRRRRHRPPTVRRGPLSRPAARGRTRRAATGQGFPRHHRSLPRHSVGVASLGPGGGTALEPAAQQRHRRALAGNECRAGARPAGCARS